MSTETQPRSKRKTRTRVQGRIPYRFTAEQVLKMVELGILGGDDVELWDGVIYKMTKLEIHNYIVARAAEVLRALMPPGYYVREEKSSAYGDFSLPEPDVAVARGRLGDSLPLPPPLEKMAILVEVDHHTSRADGVDKFSRYAEVGVPVYWHVVVKKREVRVYEEPRDRRYSRLNTYRPGQDFEIVIDGTAVGRIAVVDLFPPEPAS